MTVLYVLIVFALAVGAGFAVMVIEERRWEARSRVPQPTTYGEAHRSLAAHR